MQKLIFLVALLVLGFLGSSMAQPCSPDGATRLLNFTSDLYAGFVQVCLNGIWGTVCADSPTTLWSEKNAQVFCQGLGYSGALNSIDQSTLPSQYLVNNNSVINYRAVSCDGTEKSLSQCAHSTNTAGCDHTYDAAVVCRKAVTDGEIRLVGSTTNGKGIIEIYDQKSAQWYNVCPSSMTTNIAYIVCRQMGYYLSNFSATPMLGSTLPQRSITCTLSTCSITSSETCSYPLIYKAAVTCSNPSSFSNLRVWFEGSPSVGVGRVETFYNGQWGTICNNNNWTSLDAQVMCSLNVGGNLSSAMIGSASILDDSASIKPIWLAGITCNVNTGLCYYTKPIGYGLSCDHSKDVVLYCYGVPTPAPTTPGYDDDIGTVLPAIMVPTVLLSLTPPMIFLCFFIVKYCKNKTTADAERSVLFTKQSAKYSGTE